GAETIAVERKRRVRAFGRAALDVTVKAGEDGRLERRLGGARVELRQLLGHAITRERRAHVVERARLGEKRLGMRDQPCARVGRRAEVHMELAAITGGRFVAALEEQLRDHVLEDLVWARIGRAMIEQAVAIGAGDEPVLLLERAVAR